MHHRHRTRTWVYALVAAIAIAVATVLALSAVLGDSASTGAAGARVVVGVPAAHTRASATRACARVVAGHLDRRSSRPNERARADERTCRGLLAGSVEPGFFTPPPSATAEVGTDERNRSTR